MAPRPPSGVWQAACASFFFYIVVESSAGRVLSLRLTSGCPPTHPAAFGRQPAHASFFSKMWLKDPEEASFLCVSLVYRDQGLCLQFLVRPYSSPRLPLLSFSESRGLPSVCDRFFASFVLDYLLAFVFCGLACVAFSFTPQYLRSSLDFDSFGFYVGAFMWPACHFYHFPESGVSLLSPKCDRFFASFRLE